MSRNTTILVSLAGENRIRSYAWHSASGTLEQVGATATGSRPAPMAVSRNRKHLYVGLRGSNQIALFVLAPGQGSPAPHPALSPVACFDLHADPCYLGIDESGRWLIAAYYGAGTVTVHAIQPDATLSPAPVTCISTGSKAHCIRSNRYNDLILVPHVGVENSIHQFLLDADSGNLSPLAPYAAATSDLVGPEGPRHYVYGEATQSVYVANEHASTVTHYRYGARGIQARIATFSTLPFPAGLANTCAQIHLTPDARFLYVSNRGHDSIAIFRVDAVTGALTPCGWQETEPVPRAFAILPDGSHLLAGGLGSGCISVYAIHPEQGTLAFRTRCFAGSEPMWILPVTAT